MVEPLDILNRIRKERFPELPKELLDVIFQHHWERRFEKVDPSVKETRRLIERYGKEALEGKS